MPFCLKFLFAVGWFFVALTTPVFACDDDDRDGLDVGLVLSGGGAKASTQVGVLQVMDELGIPVHCIAGTSMGSVVGAFYAQGYSADDIADIFTTYDWGEVFRGQAPRRDKSFIEKVREESYFSGNLAAIDGDGVRFPSSLSSMQGLRSLYRDILSDVPDDIDFDDLDIPFRAVATDLETGQATVFEQGDVVEAILASMTVPGVFAPRQIDGRFYVDGGLSSTLPVETAQLMGADIIIALDVSNSPETPNAKMSVASIANQITTIVVWRSLQRDKKFLRDQDLLIEPNTVNISTAAYDRAAEGLAAGRKVGNTHREALLAIKAIAAPMRRSDSHIHMPRQTRLDNFTLINNTDLDSDLIKTRAASALSRRTTEEQDRQLRNLASFGGFGEIDLSTASGETVLTVNRHPMGRNLLQVGLNATHNFDGNSSYSILARLTRKPLSSRGGDFSLSGEFGTDIGVSAELYQPFGADGRFFIQPELFARWDLTREDIFDTRFANFWDRNLGLRTRLGRELGAWGVVALEGEVRNQRRNSLINIGTDNIPTFDVNVGGLGAYFGADTLNRTDWPTAGHRIQLRASHLFDLDETSLTSNSYDASVLKAFEVDDIGVLLNARYGQVDPGDDIALEVIQLGGFRQLTSLRDSSLPVSEFYYASAEAFYRLSSTGKLIDLPVYVGGLVEYSHNPVALIEFQETLNVYSGAAYLGVDTPLGPFFLGTSYGVNDSVKLFFKFGRTF